MIWWSNWRSESTVSTKILFCWKAFWEARESHATLNGHKKTWLSWTGRAAEPLQGLTPFGSVQRLTPLTSVIFKRESFGAKTKTSLTLESWKVIVFIWIAINGANIGNVTELGNDWSCYMGGKSCNFKLAVSFWQETDLPPMKDESIIPKRLYWLRIFNILER